MMSNNWIMKKSLTREDVEMYDTKIHEFAGAFFNYVNTDQQSKEESEKDTSTETKKRRHSTDQDENDEENMEPSGERSVKPKVTMEYHNLENLEEFIKEFKVTYLEMDNTKKDAEEELKETKRNFTRFMEKHDRNPQRAHPELTECERASLAHVRSRCQPRGRRVLFPPPRRIAIHGRVQEGTASIRISDQASTG